MVKKKKNYKILLLMGTSHGYGRQLIKGLSAYLAEQGHDADFEFRGYCEPIPTWVQNWKGDGVIVRDNSPETFTLLQEMGIPSVTVNCLNHPSDLDVDEEAVAEIAVQHFAERGICHFAYFALCDQFWTRKRESAFQQKAKQKGSPFFSYIRHATDTAPFAAWPVAEQKKLARWLQKLPKPVGLLAAYDLHARQILQVCESQNIAIPNEIAVLGINNEEWFCGMQRPPLSSILQNGLRVGYEAARLLCHKIEGKSTPPLPLLFPPVSVELRRSTDVIAIQDEDLAEALRLIRTQIGRGIQVSDLVEQIGLSRRTLERKFKQMFGHTIGEAIHQERLKQSKILLRETDDKIGTIAKRLGFSSHTHMNHAFLAEMRISPSEYRNRFRFDYE
ncbi:MAG: DNA-binding transcriptional regulator [Planctomycetia bacterium]|nr:DNA-binding transcriptional regulator [Planctomycetia bacterium]